MTSPSVAQLSSFICVLIASAKLCFADSAPVENDTSPDGKLKIVVEDAKNEPFSLKIVSKADHKVLKKLKMDLFDTDNQHHDVEAVWRSDSSAVAVSIEFGRSIIDCEVFVRIDGTWENPSFNKGQMEHVAAKLNEEGGPGRAYNEPALWTNDTLKVFCTGNNEKTYATTWRPAGSGKSLHLELVKSAPASDDEYADAQLNKAYFEVRSRLDPAGREKLKTEEKAWLAQRDKIKSAPERAQFVTERIGELKQRTEGNSK